MDALIVAGGRGTRLQPLTYTVPKPLLEFCGEPFLLGVLRSLATVGVQRAFLVVGRHTAPFEALRPQAAELGIALHTVPEPEPLDTAGGVRSVAEDLDGPVLVLNGDILTDVDHHAVLAHHHRTGADATIVLARVEDTSTFGVCVREGTRIVDFVEKPAPGTLPGQDAINAGTYVLDPAILVAHPNGPLSFERDVFPGLLRRGGHLEGFLWDGVWADLGTPDRYREGHRLVLDGQLSWPRVEDLPERTRGVRVAPSAEVAGDARLVAPAIVFDHAVVEAEAVVGPNTVVGVGARVGRGAVLAGAVLNAGAQVGAGVDAPGLIAGRGACVEPSARLGHDVVLGGDERVASGVVVADAERRPPARG